jgi:F-type H+-transporting ATPase subunit b
MKKLAFLSFIFSAVLFANEAAAGGTDIVPRTINFLIFVAILWYLIGNKVVEFFRQRRERIAAQFQEVENKLKEAKAQKELLEAKKEEAKKTAAIIIEDAKNEAIIIYNKIFEEGKLEVEAMDKLFETFKENEIRKARREVVKSYLENLLKDIHISSEDAAKLILKKVA